MLAGPTSGVPLPTRDNEQHHVAFRLAYIALTTNFMGPRVKQEVESS